MKKCSACKILKTVEFFSLDKTTKDGRNYICKHCINSNEKYKQRKRIYNKSEAGQKSYLKSHLKIKFNLTVEQKEEMLKSQNGCCAICFRQFKSLKSACIDHDHNTGKIRELLCKPCNAFLGIIKEDVNKLIAYVEKHK